jgi:hypothetical protein
MLEVFEKLKQGDGDIVAAFVAADKKWAALLVSAADEDIETIAEMLSQSQPEFERIFGERDFGKICMPWSAMSHLWSTLDGFGDDGNGAIAWKISQAFEASMCSIEVKGAARAAAEVYGVEDHADE